MRALWAALIFAATAAVGTACAQDADSLEARMRQGVAAYESGRRDEAYRIFDSFIDSYNRADGRLSSRDLYAVGVAMRHLGDRDPELFKDALRAFDEAIAKDSSNHAAAVAIGMMFLDKYNAPEAARAFDVVLRADPRNADALLGRAMALDFANEPGAVDAARSAISANPGHVGARAFLARAFWASDDLDSARVHAAAAVRSDPGSTDALIASAIVAQAEGNTAALADIRGRVATNTTAASRLNAALAEMSVQQRQYAEAVRLAQTAIAADSSYWKAWSVLGINQLRLGDMRGARSSLERSFKGDPYNVWVKNTLDLLDRLDGFTVRTGPRFTVVASEKDAGVLAPYVEALGEEAFAKLKARYGYEPPTPVRIEMFDRHADFSVRTVGLAGLGALGVSFGSVLAMDAPSAREPGDFNWGATFWHELAHAFHLGMTKHRVPRWFTEGLAVLEERRARPGWGEETLPLFMRAARENRLLPLASLNAGFSRPTYPQQVGVSYYHASLILEMIEQKHGIDALRGMLNGFAAGKSTESVLRDVLKTTPEQIDRELAPFVQQRITDEARRTAAKAANDVASLHKAGTIEALQNAMYIYPYDVAAHELLAERYASQGQWQNAVREREVIVALKPVDISEARYQLANAHFMAGDRTRARSEVLRALEAAPAFEKAQDLLLKLQDGTP